MQTVDGIGRNAQGCVKAKGDIGSRDIVVNCLGQGDDIDARFLQFYRIFLRAST